MSSAPRCIPHYTRDDYCHWQGHWELIDGVAIAMSPSPFGPHERIVSRLARMIGNQLELQRCGCEVYTNLDWIISNDTIIRPDLMVVCGEQPERHLERRPYLAVEVMSENTRTRDLTINRAIFEENKVSHYFLVDPQTKSIDFVCGLVAGTHTIGDCLEIVLDYQPNFKIAIEWARLFD